jgi:lysyl-tRNA synthetase, class II
VELTEEEKLVLNILKENSPADLNDLKTQSGLSNKKWDKAIKGLTAQKMAKVTKNEDGLVVEVVG